MSPMSPAILREIVVVLQSSDNLTHLLDLVVLPNLALIRISNSFQAVYKVVGMITGVESPLFLLVSTRLAILQ